MRTYALENRGRAPLYEYLYRCIRGDILDGTLTAGERLPSKRALAEHLHISVMTVEGAYQQLEAEGYVYTQPKRGFFVAEVERPRPAAPAPPAPEAPPEAPVWRLDLKSNQVDASRFPAAAWARLTRQVLSEDGEALLRPVPHQGLPALRQAIARAKGEPVQRDKSECLVDLRVDAFIPEKYIADGPGRIEAYKRIAAIQTPEDAADVLDELIDRYGDPPPSVSDLVNVSLVRVQATAVGVYEVTQKKDTLLLQVETLDVAMIRGLLIAFNGRVTAGAGTKPYLSVTLQPDEKPLELLQSILKAMADILAAPPEENTGKK